MSLCNICEAPATMHIGAGPRCDRHQMHSGPTLEQLHEQRARLDRQISDRFTEKMRSIDQARPLVTLRERDSVPPVLSTNAPARAASDKHFQAARQILRGFK